MDLELRKFVNVKNDMSLTPKSNELSVKESKIALKGFLFGMFAWAAVSTLIDYYHGYSCYWNL